jgi:autotransporter-associated beta strand protein
MSNSRLKSFVFAAALTISLPAVVAQADDRTWTGTTSTVWSLGTNWGGTAPTVAADNAVFTGTFVSGRQPQVQAVTTIGGIWMTGTLGQNTTITRNSTNSLTLSGNTINSIAGLGILVDNTGSQALTLSLPVAVLNAQEWRNTTNNTVTLTNAASIISGAGNLTLRSTGANLTSAFRMAAVANTFTGQLTIAEGALRISSLNNVSANGPLGFADATKPVILGDTGNKLGYIRFSDTTSNGSTNKPFILASGGRGGFYVNQGTGAGSTLTLSGLISGGGTLVKMGAQDGNAATDLVLSNTSNDWSGGTLITDGYISIAGANRLGTGTVTIDYQPQYIANSGQGHSDVAGLKFTGNTTLNSATRNIVINAGTGDVGGTIDVAIGTNTTLIGTGVISGSGGLIKTGTGTLIIADNNNFAGSTTVSAGALIVNGIQTGGGPYIVASTGILGGTGSIGSAVTVDGGFGAGATIGAIESIGTGSLSLTGTSTFGYDLDSSVLSGDLILVDGDLALGPGATLNLTDLLDAPAIAGSKLTLINYGGAWDAGIFTYLSNPLGDDTEFTLGSNTWRINYNDTSGGSNFSGEQTPGSFVTVTIVPEPGTIALLGIGILGLGIRGRRRNR